ncbi:MAG: hypothetical protein ACP5VE_03635 [Chthonomonadales bacterium]
MHTLLLATVLQYSLAALPPWRNGPPFGPGYFPIAVWLQDPANAARYKAAGFNLYIGLWKGPTEDQLHALAKAGMPVICQQNETGLKHIHDPIIVGWMHQDEPDNAQPVTDAKTGAQGWGSCIPPQKVVAEYLAMRAKDPSRPVLLNLGQGVINEQWVGRGPGASLRDYETYVKGADIVSFDIYPIAGLDRPHPEDYLWYVGAGVARLAGWTGGRKIVWNCLECTRIANGARKVTPEQLRSEAWMAIVNGSRGLIYFVHEFKPRFNEHALLDDPRMLAAATRLNAEIRKMAPIINSPDIPLPQPSETDRTSASIAAVAKRYKGSMYVFAVGMRNQETEATFHIPGTNEAGTAEALGEGRTIPVENGMFRDAFHPYEVHLYRIRLRRG